MTDVELVLSEYLNGALVAPVGTRIPSSRPDEFVRLFRTGGIMRSPTVDAPVVDFEAWGRTKAEAYDLAEQLRGEVLNLYRTQPLGAHVYRVREAGGLAYHPDSTGHDRYVFKAEIYIHGGNS